MTPALLVVGVLDLRTGIVRVHVSTGFRRRWSKEKNREWQEMEREGKRPNVRSCPMP